MQVSTIGVMLFNPDEFKFLSSFNV